MQVFSEAFKRLIEATSVSKGLLAAIKFEYEEYHALLRKKVDRADPLLAQLRTSEDAMQVLVTKHEEQRRALLNRQRHVSSGQLAKDLEQEVAGLQVGYNAVFTPFHAVLRCFNGASGGVRGRTGAPQAMRRREGDASSASGTFSAECRIHTHPNPPEPVKCRSPALASPLQPSPTLSSPP